MPRRKKGRVRIGGSLGAHDGWALLLLFPYPRLYSDGLHLLQVGDGSLVVRLGLCEVYQLVTDNSSH